MSWFNKELLKTVKSLEERVSNLEEIAALELFPEKVETDESHPLVRFIVELDDATGGVKVKLDTDPVFEDVMPGILASFFINLCSGDYNEEMFFAVNSEIGEDRINEYVERIEEEAMLKQIMLEELGKTEVEGEEESPIIEPVAVNFKGVSNDSV